jgi:hypothetical protein
MLHYLNCQGGLIESPLLESTTGIIVYLLNGEPLEYAQQMAAHERR